MNERDISDPIERELMGLPPKKMDPGAIERIEDALAAEAVLGPAMGERKPGLLDRRVPMWGMLAACLLLTAGAGVMGWTLKPVETVERIRVVTEPAPVINAEESASQSVIEIVRLDRPLFERRETRTGIDPARWTTGH